eukprot:symbB.v1.2.036044.t1/scaffold4998.1/size31953/3
MAGGYSQEAAQDGNPVPPGGNGVEEKLSTEKPNQVNYDTPRETLMMVLQRDGNQLGFASPAMRADKEVLPPFRYLIPNAKSF